MNVKIFIIIGYYYYWLLVIDYCHYEYTKCTDNVLQIPNHQLSGNKNNNNHPDGRKG